METEDIVVDEDGVVDQDGVVDEDSEGPVTLRETIPTCYTKTKIPPQPYCVSAAL